MRSRVCNWTFYCAICDYWAAFLEQNISSRDDYIFSEERNDAEIISFLDIIRIRNFDVILDQILVEQGNQSLRILDVGCASGLFIETARNRGHIVTGIEPNPVMAKIASDKGFDVINGYFPVAILSASKFDVIIFNDVFEHIPNVNELLHNCNMFLNEKGVLIINSPSSSGIFFRLAKMLAHFGFLGSWRRLWQVMFYTPHMHYFNGNSLDKLLNTHDFKNLSRAVELEALSLTGLWDRLSIDKSSYVVSRLFQFVGIVLLYPITKISNKDAFFSIYKKMATTDLVTR